MARRRLLQKKVQKSVHMTEDLYESIFQRSLITGRSISSEIERMLMKLLEIEARQNKETALMAEPTKKARMTQRPE